MNLRTTFLLNDRLKNLLAGLWLEYATLGQTASILLEMRDELGQQEFALFQEDLVRLMRNGFCARRAVYYIVLAAVQRTERRTTKNLRQIYQPA
jgi:protein subunit release factor A